MAPSDRKVQLGLKVRLGLRGNKVHKARRAQQDLWDHWDPRDPRDHKARRAYKAIPGRKDPLAQRGLKDPLLRD
jgi:hypothetical protein